MTTRMVTYQIGDEKVLCFKYALHDTEFTEGGLGTLSEFWDTTNAFPNTKFKLLDSVFENSSNPHASWFLKSRRRRVHVAIRDTSNDTVVLRLTTGDRQGDVPAPQKFTLSFDPITLRFLVVGLVQDTKKHTHIHIYI